MNKKILLIIDTLGAGGAERQLTELAIGLKEKGYEIHFVVFPVGKSRHFQTILDNAGIEVEYNQRGINKYRRIFEIVHICRSHKIDALIAYKDGVCIAAALSSPFHKAKVIVSERNTTQRLSFMERLKFACYKLADNVIPNSFSQGRFIKEHYPKLWTKTVVITNMVDCQRFQSDVATHKREVPTILTTARINRQKNILKYLDALKLLKDRGIAFKAEWYGDPKLNPEYYIQIKESIEINGLHDVFEIKKPVINVEEIYRNADIFCLPSIFEGFPNVVIEAMASGLPIACSNVCDNPYIVQEGVNGFLFNPESPEQIATTLIKLLDEIQTKRDYYSRVNREKVQSLCSRNSFISKYIELIN